jgi:lipid II:glycine glycyltransferase (peptidoglycan interpeptide bridge formation enzyme)
MEAIQSHFDPKHRNVINKALKENLEIRTNALAADQLFQFFTQALEKVGANIYEAPLKRIFQNFEGQTGAFSLSTYRGEELLGVVYCIYDQTSCYYLLGGISRVTGINGINNLLVLRCIEQAKQLGCTVFDFEGSMLKGVEKFFRGFGPDLHPYFTVNKAWKPLEMVLKFKKPELF